MTEKEVSNVCAERKVCVIIPTFNNERTLKSVVSGVLQYTSNIVVVNDGSTDSTADILAAFNSLSVVDYPVNQGKGYALRKGFEKARQLGYHFAISIDSDGQHFPDDLANLLTPLSEYKNPLVVGRRNMEQSSVPGKSNFGRNFSNFWFRFETGIALNDTQSGFRLYPLMELEKLTFFTRKFEFEIEVLVRSAWAGISVVEVPVRVFYPQKEQRVTHFRPFTDFTRISILNTVLVTIALLYIKPRNFIRSLRNGSFVQQAKTALWNPIESDFVKSVSVAFGVFMGIVPIWGFQLVAAIALAFLLRLNKMLVVLAANISIPPMIPLILFLSHETGAIWMGDKAVRISFNTNFSPDLLTASVVQYVAGAITLAIAAGIVFGSLSFLLLKLFHRKVSS
ncbi:MAG TPA: DUF2062 domain-containing protein [Chryseosolibacter sp.]|nr:DUF2062 domain-containing protein [Chryseosolibacter sp.]